MSSDALLHWRKERARRLDDLVLAHETVGGTGMGRRWRTEQLNWSLLLRVASEFQGFAMELHEMGAEEFARRAAPEKPAVETVLRNLLTRDRKLDRESANPSALGDDFGRFGITWWPAVHELDTRSAGRVELLANLNKARNAIAHDKPGLRAQLVAAGFPLTLRTFRRTRRALDALATTMDTVLAIHMIKLFGSPAPW